MKSKIFQQDFLEEVNYTDTGKIAKQTEIIVIEDKI